MQKEAHTQELSVNVGLQPDQWLRQAGQHHGANERPRDGAREGKVIIFSAQRLGDIASRNPRGQDIMNSLDVERLLYLSVGSCGEMEENKGRDCGEEQQED